MVFSQHGQSLEAHPYAFTLYVEERLASHRDAASHSGGSFSFVFVLVAVLGLIFIH